MWFDKLATNGINTLPSVLMLSLVEASKDLISTSLSVNFIGAGKLTTWVATGHFPHLLHCAVFIIGPRHENTPG